MAAHALAPSYSAMLCLQLLYCIAHKVCCPSWRVEQEKGFITSCCTVFFSCIIILLLVALKSSKAAYSLL